MSETKQAETTTEPSLRLVAECTKTKKTQSSSSSPASFTHRVKRHIYTIWLFSFSDIKTIIAPQTFFSICTALSQLQKHNPATLGKQGIIVFRTPLVMFWIWINLLPFNINHQRQPGSLKEDTINKPWRPLVTGRWSASMTFRAMIMFYTVAFLTSWAIGGVRPNLALILLGYIYNECGGADNDPIVRNLLNALGITAFSIGSLEVALQQKLNFELFHFKFPLVPCLENWFAVLALIIFSTIQFQDMGDMEGDAAHGRQTFPLKYGETFTRWFNCVAVLFWSFWCLRFWESGVLGHVCVVPLGFYTAYRTVVLRTQNLDKNSYRIYNAWVATLYFLPLLKVLV